VELGGIEDKHGERRRPQVLATCGLPESRLRDLNPGLPLYENPGTGPSLSAEMPENASHFAHSNRKDGFCKAVRRSAKNSEEEP
jgi:hypothetical protein